MASTVAEQTVPQRGQGPGQGRVAYLRRRRAATRGAILLAAREVFARASYIDATIEDILRAASVSRATFYQHFQSKLELAHAIHEEIVPQTRALFARLPALAQGDVDGLDQWLRDFIGIHVEHRYVTPLIAQLQLFESGFRQRILAESESLIDLVADAGVPSFVRTRGADSTARRQRLRARLLFSRAATACADIARGELAPSDADLCIDLVARELLDFLQE